MSVNDDQDWEALGAQNGEEKALTAPVALNGENLPATPGDVDPYGWLYDVQPRIGLSTDKAFIHIKSSDTLVKQFTAVVQDVHRFHSHRQPNPLAKNDAGKPEHASPNDWCESDNNKQTSRDGYDCHSCPAISACSFKLAVTVNSPELGEAHILTMPTVSAIRFSDAMRQLYKQYKYRFDDPAVGWLFYHITFDDRQQGMTYPIIMAMPIDAEGNEIKLDEKQAKPQAPALPRANGARPAAPVPPSMVQTELQKKWPLLMQLYKAAYGPATEEEIAGWVEEFNGKRLKELTPEDIDATRKELNAKAQDIAEVTRDLPKAPTIPSKKTGRR